MDPNRTPTDWNNPRVINPSLGLAGVPRFIENSPQNRRPMTLLKKEEKGVEPAMRKAFKL